MRVEPFIHPYTITNSLDGELTVKPACATAGQHVVEIARHVIGAHEIRPNTRLGINIDEWGDGKDSTIASLAALAQEQGVLIAIKIRNDDTYEFSRVDTSMVEGFLLACHHRYRPVESSHRFRAVRLEGNDRSSVEIKPSILNSRSNDDLEDIVDELMKEEPSSLNIQEALFLKIYAHRMMHRNGYVALKIFRYLQDFIGIRQCVGEGLLGEYDKIRALLTLEEYKMVLRLVECNWQKVTEDTYSDLFGEISRAFNRFYDDATSAIPGAVAFKPFLIASDLMVLRSQYDIVISIAKGGLFPGEVARLLGMPVRVVEIHAHRRKRPQVRLAENLKDEEIRGKRVLVVDKDTITGASVLTAQKIIGKFMPACMGAYFALPPGHLIGSSAKAIQALRSHGITVHHSKNLSKQPLYEIHQELHRRLKTPWGRLDSVMSEFEALLDEVKQNDTANVKKIRLFIAKKAKLFQSFNANIPGVERVRDRIVSQLESLLKLFKDKLEFEVETRVAIGFMATMLSRAPIMPDGIGDVLANARYADWGKRLARERNISNEHSPHSMTSSFVNAQQALAKGRYSVVLIVGPEGFAYEPLFRDIGRDLRLRVVSVNIPEADFNGERSIQVLDDLKALEGQRVLVVEDDVQSGATLRKLLEHVTPHRPAFLGLYLGSEPHYQMRENIPPEFKSVYARKRDPMKDERDFLAYLKKREVLFKD